MVEDDGRDPDAFEAARDMSDPKFKPGQVVEFVRLDRTAPSGAYAIVRLMPSEAIGRRYRVRRRVPAIPKAGTRSTAQD